MMKRFVGEDDPELGSGRDNLAMMVQTQIWPDPSGTKPGKAWRHRGSTGPGGSAGREAGDGAVSSERHEQLFMDDSTSPSSARRADEAQIRRGPRMAAMSYARSGKDEAGDDKEARIRGQH